MSDWQRTIIHRAATIKDAITNLDSGHAKIVLILNDDETLLGTITDGDIRRAILNDVSFDAPALSIANRQPRVMPIDTSAIELLQVMQTYFLHFIPLNDDHERIVGLAGFDTPTHADIKAPNRAVIMAGGKGTRLHPLTLDTPKPMLELAGRPILEIIIESLATHGITDITISLNYQFEKIRNHFGDGQQLGVHIKYINEDKPSGTGGALRLLHEKPRDPVLVMNGDILTRVDYRSLIDFHRESKCAAVVAARSYDIEVPFGVIDVKDGLMQKIIEKPTQSFLVNAGIYVLSPDVFEHLPDAAFFDMTDLLQHITSQDMKISVFPIREYWLDIGRHDQLEKARADVISNF